MNILSSSDCSIAYIYYKAYDELWMLTSFVCLLSWNAIRICQVMQIFILNYSKYFDIQQISPI